MLNRLVTALALVTIIASRPAIAQETPWPGATWHLWRTDQGCLYYNPAAWTAAKAATYRKTWYFSIRWEGSPCEPGKLINGAGTLVQVSNLKVTSGSPGKGINRYAGTMVNGLWNGLVVHSDEYPQGSSTYRPFKRTMGCSDDLGPCTPPRPTPHLSDDQKNSGVAAQGAETQAPFSSGPGGSSVPPLRATATLEAHNPANEASDCLDLITKNNYERMGVSSTQGAAFRNRCPFPVEARWCIGSRCATGYDNLATMPAKNDRGISYDAQPDVIIQTKWAGCRQGFAYRPDFAGTLNYACK